MRKLLVILVFACLQPAGFSTGVFKTIDVSQRGSFPVGGAVYFLEAKEQRITAEIIQAQYLRNPAAWRKAGGDGIAGSGYTSKEIWAAIFLTNSGKTPVHRYLSFELATLDHLDIYSAPFGREIMGYSFGNSLRPEERSLLSVLPYIEVKLDAREILPVLFKVQSQAAIQWPIVIRDEYSFSKSVLTFISIEMLFNGTVLALVIIQLIQYIIYRRKDSLWYLASGLSILAFFAAIQGTGNLLLWGYWPEFSRNVMVYFMAAMYFFTIGFAYCVLDLDSEYPRLMIGFRWAQRVAVLWLVFPSLFGYQFAIFSIMIVASVVALATIVIAIFQARTGKKRAVIYVSSWAMFFLVAILFMLAKIGLIETSIMFNRLFQLATITQLLLLFYTWSYIGHQESTQRFKHVEESLALEKNFANSLEAQIIQRTNENTILQDQIIQISGTDGLSGLYSREYFNKNFPLEIKRMNRTHDHLSLLLFDIRQFGKLNLKYGNINGDKAIRTVAKIIAKNIKRESDWSARFGSNEFAVVLPSTKSSDALNVGQRILDEIHQTKISGIDEETEEVINFKIFVRAGCYGDIPLSESALLFLSRVNKAIIKAKRLDEHNVILYAED